MELLETLLRKMRKGIVDFSYLKKNGQKRKASGTLYGIGHTIKNNNQRNKCTYTLCYYDVDCNDWRSFIIENLIEVGSVREQTIQEHHNICLALVVKLKEEMKKDGNAAFAYRKDDGSIYQANGMIIEDECNENYFVYYDTDKHEKCKCKIDSIIGIGEKENYEYNDNAEKTKENTSNHNSISHYNIKNVLKSKGIDLDSIENIMITDLVNEMSKEQLKDLVYKAVERMATL